MTDIPDLKHFLGRNLSYDKGKLAAYDKLLSGESSPFKGQTMATVFIYAAALGFKRRNRQALKQAVPNISAVALSEDQVALLLAIPISTEGIEILFDGAKALGIINEYANGGIDLLWDEFVGPLARGGEPVDKMASSMRRLLRKPAPRA